MFRVLNVAEKNDAAKGIADILSRGRFNRRNGPAMYNKIYEFDGHVFGRNANMVVTSVSGHLFSYDFTGQHRGNWENVPFLALFDAPIEKVVNDDNGRILVQQLESEASRAQHLIIWTDCDREGENIGFEIINVCTRRNPRLQVHRARFSEITYRSITNALQNLVQADRRISDAVDCRQELDLRIGAAFTRFQTLRLRRAFPARLRDLIISYGSCQFPTLGFVVERYKAREEFVQEPFWKLVLKHTKHAGDGSAKPTEFSWRRIRLFDQEICEVYLRKCREVPVATVENVTTKPKTRWRPTALDTVELEKIASRRLRLTAKRTMEAAERLYTKGFISYPRTETNQFPRDIDLGALVQNFVTDHQLGNFAQDILQRGVNPRNGTKSDQAHPPIHPIRYATPMELQGEEKSVYEFVVRRFLACVSRDAKGLETVVDVDMNGEKFYASGLIITDRGYLEVYHQYEQWNDKNIPLYEKDETFTPDSIEVVAGQTSPPSLLTEADLIALMEKHGIGTDATHAEHIEKIKTRCYAALNEDRRFIPGYLGLGLVDGYDSMGHPMSKPRLRAELEAGLKEICEGRKSRDDVLLVQIAKYKDIFERVMNDANRLDDAIARYFGADDRRAPSPPRFGGGHGNGPGDGPGGGPGFGGPGGGSRPAGGGGRGRGGGTGFGPSYDGGGRGNDHGRNDDNATNGDSSSVLCNCGVQPKICVVKKNNQNKGRSFYACSLKTLNGPEGCNFFQWVDNNTTAAASQHNTRISIGLSQGGSDQPSTSWKNSGNQRKNSGNYSRSLSQHSNMFPAPIVSGSGGGGKGKRRSFNKGNNSNENFSKKQRKKNFGNGSNTKFRGGGQRKCGYCHQMGHTVKTCPQKLRE